MPVSPEFQPVIDELNTIATNLTTSLDAKIAAAVTDKADTLAAVQAAADAVKTAASV